MIKVKVKVIKRFYDKTADLALRKANTELEFTPISIHTFRVEGDSKNIQTKNTIHFMLVK